jgi:hypothetical protein
MIIDIPFDVSYSFNDDLHDIPNHPDEMRQALTFLQAQLDDDAIDDDRRIQLLGAIGGYARMLNELAI